MARNFLSISGSYLEQVPERTRRLDAAVVEFLDEEYNLAWGEAADARKSLKKAGWPLNKTQLEARIRRFRVPYLLLRNQATLAMKKIARRRHKQVEGWECLVNDGFTTWLKVERRLAKVPAKPSATKRASGRTAVPLFESPQIVILSRTDYDRIVETCKRLRQLALDI